MTHTALPQTPPWVHPAVCDREYFRMSVEEYEELGEQGIITTNSRLELIEGNLVRKPVQNDPHAASVENLTNLFVRLAPAGWRVRIQLPIRILESVPEPDAVIASGDHKSAPRRHPTAGEIGLIVEVSDSTLGYDRTIKMPLYSRARIPQYWIVNLVDSVVEVYTDPTFDNGYATRRDFKPEDSVPLVLNGETITSLRVADLLP